MTLAGRRRRARDITRGRGRGDRRRRRARHHGRRRGRRGQPARGPPAASRARTMPPARAASSPRGSGPPRVPATRPRPVVRAGCLTKRIRLALTEPRRAQHDRGAECHHHHAGHDRAGREHDELPAAGALSRAGVPLLHGAGERADLAPEIVEEIGHVSMPPSRCGRERPHDDLLECPAHLGPELAHGQGTAASTHRRLRARRPARQHLVEQRRHREYIALVSGLAGEGLLRRLVGSGGRSHRARPPAAQPARRPHPVDAEVGELDPLVLSHQRPRSAG